jgi:hypothetical protein
LGYLPRNGATHKYSYGDKSESSAKSKHALWATSKWKPSTLFRSIQKFMGQLNKIFNNETVDLVHVSERIQAAFGIS